MQCWLDVQPAGPILDVQRPAGRQIDVQPRQHQVVDQLRAGLD